MNSLIPQSNYNSCNTVFFFFSNKQYKRNYTKKRKESETSMLNVYTTYDVSDITYFKSNNTLKVMIYL